MKTWKLFAILAVLASSIAFLHQGLERHRYTRAQSDFSYLPSTQQVRILSLGHTETAASLMWVRGVLYFGSSLMEKTDTKWMEHLIDLVTTTDPKFKEAYSFLATAIQAEDMTERGIKIQDQGVRLFPEDWHLALYYSMNPIKFNENYKKAASIMKRYTADESVPQHIRQIHVSLLRKQLPIAEGLSLYLGEYFSQHNQDLANNLRNKISYFLSSTLNPKIQRPFMDLFSKFKQGEISKLDLFNNLLIEKDKLDKSNHK